MKFHSLNTLTQHPKGQPPLIIIIIRVEKSIELVGVNSKIVNFVNCLWRNGTQGLFRKQNRK